MTVSPMMTKQKALEQVADDIIVLLTKEPFYAYLLVKMQKVIDQRVPVAGVSVINGDIKLYINPEGYLSYTKPERLFILKHEVLHIINIHYLRRRDRDPSLFNVAADIAINQLIESPYCQFPVDALRIDSWKKDKGFVLPEKEPAETYYQLLWQRGEQLDLPQDLLNSVVGRHLSGGACSNCGGTGHEPKPEKISGVISSIDHTRQTLDVDGKFIHANNDTEYEGVDGSPVTFDDLDVGTIVEIEAKTMGGYKRTALSIKVQNIRGKIEEIDEMKKTFKVDGKLVTTNKDTEFFDADSNNIDFDDLEVGANVEVEADFLKKTADGYMYDALKVTIKKEEENEDDQDQNGDGSGEGSGDGSSDDSCSCCGGSGKDPSGGQGQGGEGRAPGFANLHPTWDESTEVSEQLAESIVRSMIQEAYQKSRGTVPGSIKQMIEDILKSKVNWRAVLRNFVAKRRSTKKSATWRKRSRRLGTMVPGNKKNRKLSLVVAIDTSGSVSDKELSMFAGEIQKIYQNGADIVIIECDADVQNVYKYDRKIDKKGKDGLTFAGRGGTDFRPVFDYIDEKRDKLIQTKPDAIIFLTDGYGPAPDSYKTPTLWCLTPGGRRPYNSSMGGEVSWGSVITLED